MMLLAVAGSAALRSIAINAPLLPDVRFAAHYEVGPTLPFPVLMDNPAGARAVLIFYFLMGAMALCSLQLLRTLSSRGNTAVRLFVACAIAITFVMTLWSTLFSVDVYAYVLFGRVYGLYGINPYTLNASLLPHDPVIDQLVRLFGNAPPADNYGPLWTMLAGLLGRAGSHLQLGAQVWLYRFVGAAAAIATLLGLLFMLRSVEVGERIRRAGRFALNPLILYESAAAGHNDILMVAPAVWAFAVVDLSAVGAGLLLGLAIAMKYAAIVALPFLLIRQSRSGWRAALLAGAIALAVPILSFTPLWHGAETVRTVFQLRTLVITSPQWLLSMWLPPQVTQSIVLKSLPAVLASAAVVYCVLRYAKDRAWKDIVGAYAAILWASPVINPWYVQWIMPGAVLAGRVGTYVWWFGLLVLLRYSQDAVRFPSTQRDIASMLALLEVTTLLFLGLPLVIAALRHRRLPQRPPL